MRSRRLAKPENEHGAISNDRVATSIDREARTIDRVATYNDREAAYIRSVAASNDCEVNYICSAAAFDDRAAAFIHSVAAFTHQIATFKHPSPAFAPLLTKEGWRPDAFGRGDGVVLSFSTPNTGHFSPFTVHYFP